MPAQRGNGRGREMMSAVIERARACGLQKLSLEVLAENTNAFQLYQRAGMHVVRDLLMMERAEKPSAGESLPTLKEGAPAELLDNFARLHRQPPAWGRALPSLLVTDGLRGFYTGDQDQPDAYALIAARAPGTFVVDLAAAEPVHAEDCAPLSISLPNRSSSSTNPKAASLSSRFSPAAGLKRDASTKC